MTAFTASPPIIPQAHFEDVAKRVQGEVSSVLAKGIEELRSTHRSNSPNPIFKELEAARTHVATLKTQLDLASAEIQKHKSQFNDHQQLHNELNSKLIAAQGALATIETKYERERIQAQSQFDHERLQWKFEQSKNEANKELERATIRAELNSELMKYAAEQSRLQEIIKSLTANHTLAIDNATRKARDDTQFANGKAIEKAAELGKELELTQQNLKHAIENSKKLEAQIEELKTAKPTTPADKGNVAELEIEQLLEYNLGHIMNIKNVSKIRQGHEMDLELVSRDESIRIRIDVKNAIKIKEKEFKRFHDEVDALKPTAAILFLQQSLTGKAALTNRDIHKRGNTIVFHIGGFSKTLLIETILEIFVEHKVNVQTAINAQKPFAGSQEVSTLVQELANLVQYMHSQAAVAGTALHNWKTIGTQKHRDVAGIMKIAHTANKNAVPQDVLIQFEKAEPNRPRGRPPKTENIKIEPEEKNTRKRKPKTQNPTPKKQQKTIDQAFAKNSPTNY